MATRRASSGPAQIHHKRQRALLSLGLPGNPSSRSCCTLSWLVYAVAGRILVVQPDTHTVCRMLSWVTAGLMAPGARPWSAAIGTTRRRIRAGQRPSMPRSGPGRSAHSRSGSRYRATPHDFVISDPVEMGRGPLPYCRSSFVTAIKAGATPPHQLRWRAHEAHLASICNPICNRTRLQKPVSGNTTRFARTRIASPRYWVIPDNTHVSGRGSRGPLAGVKPLLMAPPPLPCACAARRKKICHRLSLDAYSISMDCFR
jgi:hypothetical protein